MSQTINPTPEKEEDKKDKKIRPKKRDVRKKK